MEKTQRPNELILRTIIICLGFSFFVLIPIFLYKITISKSEYRGLSILFFLLTLTTFFISMFLQKGGHNFAHEPFCFMGRISINGNKNYAGFIGFLVSSLLFGVLALILGNLIIMILPSDIFRHITGWAAGISGFAMIMLGVIPIDIIRPLHLKSALLLNISYVVLNTFCMLFIIFSRLKLYGYLFFVVFHYISAICYWYAYTHHFRASLCQKFWYFSMVFGLFGYLDFFIKTIK